MTVSLVKLTDAQIYVHVNNVGLTVDRTGDDIIKAAQELACELADKYNVETYKWTDELGICYLTSARRTKAGVSTTYANERAIINNYNKAVAAKLNYIKEEAN